MPSARRGALAGGIPAPQLQRVHSDPFGELVDHGLGREGGVRSSRGAVGARFRLVDDDVVGVDGDVGNVVRGENALGAGADGRPGISAGFVHHVAVGGDEAAVIGRPHPDALERPGGRTGRLEHLAPAHQHLHRVAGLVRHHRCGRLHVDREFATEPAADFTGDHLDFRDRQLQHFRKLGADLERPLSAHPDGDRPVLLPEDGGVVGLDVTLVNGCGVKLRLDDDIRLGKAFAEVPHLVLVVAGDVALPARILSHGLGGAIFVEQRSPLFHRFAHVDDGRQRLVLHVDQGQRLFGDVRTRRRHCGHCVALVQNFVRSQAVLGDLADVDQGFPDV